MKAFWSKDNCLLAMGPGMERGGALVDVQWDQKWEWILSAAGSRSIEKVNRHDLKHHQRQIQDFPAGYHVNPEN